MVYNGLQSFFVNLLITIKPQRNQSDHHRWGFGFMNYTKQTMMHDRIQAFCQNENVKNMLAYCMKQFRLEFEKVFVEIRINVIKESYRIINIFYVYT